MAEQDALTLPPSFEDFLRWEAASRDTIDFKKCYFDVCGDLAAALVLSQVVFWHLPNRRGDDKLRVKRDGELWLVKTADQWWDECRLTPHQARRALEILEDKGLLEVRIFKFSGVPTTHIRLVREGFLAALTSTIAKLDFTDPQNGPAPERKSLDLPRNASPLTETNRDHEERAAIAAAGARKSRLVVPGGSGFAPKTIKAKAGLEEWHIAISQEFKQGLATAGFKPGNEKAATLCDGFRLLEKVDGVARQAIELVVRWYVRHINDEYMPQAYTSQEFRLKWNAIKREYDKSTSRQTAGPQPNYQGKVWRVGDVWDGTGPSPACIDCENRVTKSALIHDLAKGRPGYRFGDVPPGSALYKEVERELQEQGRL